MWPTGYSALALGGTALRAGLCALKEFWPRDIGVLFAVSLIAVVGLPLASLQVGEAAIGRSYQ